MSKKLITKTDNRDAFLREALELSSFIKELKKEKEKEKEKYEAKSNYLIPLFFKNLFKK